MVPPFCFEFRDLARLLNLLVSCGVLKGHTIGGPTTFVTLGHGQDVQLCSGVLPSRLPAQGIVIAVLGTVRIKKQGGESLWSHQVMVPPLRFGFRDLPRLLEFNLVRSFLPAASQIKPS